MNCIIVDDEPLAREAIELQITRHGRLNLTGEFNSAHSASVFMADNPVDLVFLDIRMPGVSGLEFARTIPKTTLVIFTTAFARYALDSYEVDAIDYLVKPVETEKFRKAADKAIAYHNLLLAEEKNSIESVDAEFIFVRSDRRYVKVGFSDILFVEGLKDYIIIQRKEDRVITRMTLKSIEELLPKRTFMKVNRSYIINRDRVDSFDANDVFIGKYEIAVGNNYRDTFFAEFLAGKV